MKINKFLKSLRHDALMTAIVPKVSKTFEKFESQCEVKKTLCPERLTATNKRISSVIRQ